MSESKVLQGSRKKVLAVAVLGMCDGLAMMLIENHAGKKVLPAYGKALNKKVSKALDLWGRIDLREGSKGAAKRMTVVKNIQALDEFWTEHRTSPLVYSTMLLPMIADIMGENNNAKRPDPEKTVLLARIEAVLFKIYRYYEQRGKAHDELVNYGENLYRKWME